MLLSWFHQFLVPFPFQATDVAAEMKRKLEKKEKKRKKREKKLQELAANGETNGEAEVSFVDFFLLHVQIWDLTHIYGLASVYGMLDQI